VSKPNDAERMEKMGLKDPKRIYDTTDLAPAEDDFRGALASPTEIC